MRLYTFLKPLKVSKALKMKQQSSNKKFYCYFTGYFSLFIHWKLYCWQDTIGKQKKISKINSSTFVKQQGE